jgi:hypothetical protein
MMLRAKGQPLDRFSGSGASFPDKANALDPIRFEDSSKRANPCAASGNYFRRKAEWLLSAKCEKVGS